MYPVDEEEEAHGSCRHLSAIEDLVMALRAPRRLIVCSPRGKRGIEGRCVHPLLQLLPYVPYHIEKLAYISAVER